MTRKMSSDGEQATGAANTSHRYNLRGERGRDNLNESIRELNRQATPVANPGTGGTRELVLTADMFSDLIKDNVAEVAQRVEANEQRVKSIIELVNKQFQDVGTRLGKLETTIKTIHQFSTKTTAVTDELIKVTGLVAEGREEVTRLKTEIKKVIGELEEKVDASERGGRAQRDELKEKIESAEERLHHEVRDLAMRIEGVEDNLQKKVWAMGMEVDSRGQAYSGQIKELQEQVVKVCGTSSEVAQQMRTLMQEIKKAQGQEGDRQGSVEMGVGYMDGQERGREPMGYDGTREREGESDRREPVGYDRTREREGEFDRTREQNFRVRLLTDSRREQDMEQVDSLEEGEANRDRYMGRRGGDLRRRQGGSRDNRNRYPVRDPQLPKLDHFDGKADNWLGFVNNFETRAELLGLDRDMKLVQFQLFLKGPALGYFLQLPERVRTDYASAKAAMKEHFLEEIPAEARRVAFNNLHQRDKETISEFAERVRDASVGAFTGWSEEQINEERVNVFLRGLGASEASLYVMNQRRLGDTLHHAVTQVNKFVCNQEALTNRKMKVRQARNWEGEGERDSRGHCRDRNTPESSESDKEPRVRRNAASKWKPQPENKKTEINEGSDFKDILKSHEEKMEEILKIMAEISANIKERSEVSSHRGDERRRDTQRGDRRCFGCGEKGHFKRECPYRSTSNTDSPGSSRSPSPAEQKVTFNLNEKGGGK